LPAELVAGAMGGLGLERSGPPEVVRFDRRRDLEADGLPAEAERR
jgi:hypothetical protein